MDEAREAKRLLLKRLGKPTWLIGVGIAKFDDKPAVKVIGKLDTDQSKSLVPRSINGVRVIYEHSGPVRKSPK
jgi:hypothetical protein